MLDGILFFLPLTAFRRQALLLLGRELGDELAGVVWNSVHAHRQQLAKTRPEHSLGVNLLIRYMELDIALYRSLLAAGIAQPRAGELIQALNWQLFSPATAVLYKLSRLRSRRILVRCRWILDVLFAVLFTSPFERKPLPASDHIGFDVTCCPLAGYFKSQGVPELTGFAACSLDHDMARVWGLELRRTTTIATDAPLCDFRFYPKSGKIDQ